MVFQKLSKLRQIYLIIKTYIFLYPRVFHDLWQHFQIFFTENRDNFMWISPNKLVDELSLVLIYENSIFKIVFYLCCFSDSLSLEQTKQIHLFSSTSTCLTGIHSLWNDRRQCAQFNDVSFLWQCQQYSSCLSCGVGKKYEWHSLAQNKERNTKNEMYKFIMKFSCKIMKILDKISK